MLLDARITSLPDRIRAVSALPLLYSLIGTARNRTASIRRATYATCSPASRPSHQPYRATPAMECRRPRLRPQFGTEITIQSSISVHKARSVDIYLPHLSTRSGFGRLPSSRCRHQGGRVHKSGCKHSRPDAPAGILPRRAAASDGDGVGVLRGVGQNRAATCGSDRRAADFPRIRQPPVGDHSSLPAAAN